MRISVAFVLINVAPMHEHEVYNNLLKTEKILEVHPLFGEYDLIVKIEINSFRDLAGFVGDKLKSMRGVLDTKTLTGVEP